MRLSNPILPDGADPWITLHNGWYYYTHTTGRGISVWKSKSISQLKNVVASQVWTPPAAGPYSDNIWAPELHFLRGKWYIYFAADDGNWAHHKMYVLESEGEDALGPYKFLGKIADTRDEWAIDGTVLEREDGSLYFIWSGSTVQEQSGINVSTYESWLQGKIVSHPAKQSLYIAKMKNPWTLEGEGVEIASPTYEWEKQGIYGVNEGPTVIKKNGKIFILYSGSHSWTEKYCLGLLMCRNNTDILNPSSWVKWSSPVFQSSEKIHGPGHASVVTSADGTEDWLLYHASQNLSSGWTRQVHAQPYSWTDEGTPYFGTPLHRVDIS